jgi:hypothetical protein
MFRTCGQPDNHIPKSLEGRDCTIRAVDILEQAYPGRIWYPGGRKFYVGFLEEIGSGLTVQDSYFLEESAAVLFSSDWSYNFDGRKKHVTFTLHDKGKKLTLLEHGVFSLVYESDPLNNTYHAIPMFVRGMDFAHYMYMKVQYKAAVIMPTFEPYEENDYGWFFGE